MQLEIHTTPSTTTAHVSFNAALCSTGCDVCDSLRTMQVLEARKRELGRLRQAIPARVGMQVLTAHKLLLLLSLMMLLSVKIHENQMPTCL